MKFSERLQAAMDAANEGRGISQAELARQVKVTRAAVAHWLAAEGSTYPMKGEILLRLAYVLRVSPFWLLEEYGAQDAIFVHQTDAIELLKYFFALPSHAQAVALDQIKQLFSLFSPISNSVTASYGGSIENSRYRQKLQQAQKDLAAAETRGEHAETGESGSSGGG